MVITAKVTDPDGVGSVILLYQVVEPSGASDANVTTTYAYDALGSHMSQETLEFHHDKHHNAYLVAMNDMIAGLKARLEQNPEDLEGWLLMSALAEPHAHLDKALTAEEVPNPKGDLLGAIDAWIAAAEQGVFTHLPYIAPAAVLFLGASALHESATEPVQRITTAYIAANVVILCVGAC